MNSKEFAQFAKEMNDERLELSRKKQLDYATEDALSNFKRVNQVCKVWHIDVRRSPAECAKFLMILKMDRWNNLRGRDPENETIRDTIKDLHNYIDLAYACEIEV